MSRAEPRTHDTATCPDVAHRHTWSRRRHCDVASFDVDAAGVVQITEEALTGLLRAAGFHPDTELQEPGT